MARFVLVHGAFGGAWSWPSITYALENAGHTVVAIDLPGAGEDQTPVAEVTLDAYAARICATLAERPDPAILVGHSMGGVAITQAAARCAQHVALLVYVAAFMPGDGQSLLDLTQLPEGADDQVQANLAVSGDPPAGMLSAEALELALLGCCSSEQVANAVGLARPQALAPFVTPVAIPSGALDGLARAYVFCTRDRAIPPALQQRMIREHPCVDVVEIETDHSPFFSAPDALTAALVRFAAAPA
jgi:pimeloyl-ACP methyl ester carboxylesterase